MFERSRRTPSEEDRAILERYRQNAMGTVRFEAKSTFLAGTAGLALGVLWLGVRHGGDPSAPFWHLLGLVAAATAVGAAIGLPFDYLRSRKQRREREAKAAATWDPVIAAGTVECLVAGASGAVRIDDDTAGTAWFLAVAENQMLCVWDWVEAATEHVEIDLVPGTAPRALKIAWTGRQLAPPRPKRKFQRGEYRPEQGEVLAGTLEDLDGVLRDRRPAKRGPKPERPAAMATPASKLADDVEPLGFYKYVAADQVSEVKAEIANGAYEWYVAAARGFDADAESLTEGGVKDLLDYMRPALEVEGWHLEEIDESYDPGRGYTVRIGGDPHTMWHEEERQKSAELTTARTAGLINQWLIAAGSEERLHVLHGGHEAVFVLLTPGMQHAIARSGAFRSDDLPVPV